MSKEATDTIGQMKMARVFALVIFICLAPFLHSQTYIATDPSPEDQENYGSLSLPSGSLVYGQLLMTDLQTRYTLNCKSEYVKVSPDGYVIARRVIHEGVKQCYVESLGMLPNNRIAAVGTLGNNPDSCDIFIEVMDTSLNRISFVVLVDSLGLEVATGMIVDREGNIVLSGMQFVPPSNSMAIFRKYRTDGSLIGQFNANPGISFAWDIMETEWGYYGFSEGLEDGTGSTANCERISLDPELNRLDIDTLTMSFSSPLTAKWLTPTKYVVGGQFDAFDYPFPGISLATLGLHVSDSTKSYYRMHKIGESYVRDDVARKSLAVVPGVGCFFGGTNNQDLQRILRNDSVMTDQKSWVSLTKMDTSANVLWTKYFGGDAHYVLNSVTPTPQGGCIMIGNVFNPELDSTNERDLFIIKVNAEGEFEKKPVEEPEPVKEINGFGIGPNPSSGEINVWNGLGRGVTLEMLDAEGRRVWLQDVPEGKFGYDLESLARGLYTFRVTGMASPIEGKLMLIE